ncbi:ArsR/SmtB family transcription factor [Mycolicibacterium mageritense]|uniref:ArsR/SmtB family transcription factor n=1 Tax=Mycolicibacterium mageritense TaxID=53462 RepID=UPI001E321A5B|nr:winged helix-turn-helix domain-containing protein [Mycolicibacterium mageritense]GJJ19074.1 ArsR family transcriptional regulator [Mycolicibacterium mageritense]
MTLLKLSPNALAHCRFAISPLAETVGVMITLQRRCTDPAVARWHAEHQPAYRRWLGADPIAAALLPLIASTKRFPDMIALPPEHGMNTRLSDELATMTTFSDDQIRAGVRAAAAASWKTHRLDWLDTPNLAARTAELFQQGWQQFVEPDWPRRRGVLERDIMYRAGLLAAYGWRHTVETMKQRSVWVGDNAIRFSNLHWPDRLIDDGLIFVPRTTTGGWWTCEQPPRYALVYSAYGPHAAPTAGADGGTDALSTLLGPGRARIARQLQIPATSTQLAHILGQSLGTVSKHLAVLRDAGTVAGTRVGRSVTYRLTEQGHRLVQLLDESPAISPDGPRHTAAAWSRRATRAARGDTTRRR